MWIQEKEESGEIKYNKVWGEHNPADVLTKAVEKGRLERLASWVGLREREGLADKGLNI